MGQNKQIIIYKVLFFSTILGSILLPLLTYGATNTHSTDLESTSSQYWSKTDTSELDMNATDFTISAWVKIESDLEGEQTIAAKFLSAGDQRAYAWYLQTSANTLNLSTCTGTCGAENTVSYTASIDTWVFFTVVFDNGANETKHYVNGIQQGATQTGTEISNTTASFTIGAYSNPTSFQDGLIDDVRIWKRELSGAEITSLYTDPCNFDNGTDLKGMWLFNNDGTDESGNGFTLTNNNTATFSTDKAYTCTENTTETETATTTLNNIQSQILTSVMIYFTLILTIFFIIYTYNKL